MDNQDEGKVISNEPGGRGSQDTVVVSNINWPAQSAGIQRDISPLRFLVITIGGIFLAEVVAMIFIYSFQNLPYYIQTIIDASIMIVMVSPVLYFFFLRPLIRHIEKRDRAEEALRQSEARFRKVFHSSPASLSIARLVDGIFIDVNESFLHMFGHNREEVIGHTSIELEMFVNPDERAELNRRLLRRRLLGQQGIRAYEMATRTKSGELRSVLVSMEDIELNGEICILAALSDITEHKRDEERLRKAYDELELRVQERTEELRIANSELEEEIIERMQAEEELQVANQELTRFNNAMVGRELRMIELKNEVNELCGSTGQPVRYPLDFEREEQ